MVAYSLGSGSGFERRKFEDRIGLPGPRAEKKKGIITNIVNVEVKNRFGLFTKLRNRRKLLS